MNEHETYTKVCQSDNGLGYELGLVSSTNLANISPIQAQLFAEAKQRVGVDEFDAISFSGETPIAYFRLLSKYDADYIRELHKRVWNQSRVPSLYIITPAELRVYNCYDEPVEPHQNIEDRLIHRINVAEEALDQNHTFAKIQFDSGEFWKTEFGRSYDSEKRVESHLLAQLKATRRHLYTDYELPLSVIHDLLGRAIFILYLEDRGAIREGYYSELFLDGATSFIDVMQDKKATYDLFDALATRFNGDLLPVTEEEKRLVTIQHLSVIRNLFGGGDVKTGQMALWRPYDFRAIPIELISAIYEEFLQKELGSQNTRNNGVYYTPLPLVEFVMNEVLPWPSSQDHNYELCILDPACGSGIFLVEAYRRLVARWMYSHQRTTIEPEQLKQLLTAYIFGIDINPDAIRVAAFSLYLALLDHLSPRTIWERFQFPYLIHGDSATIQSGSNLFSLDTFTENIPFAHNEFDLVIGNPPWKRKDLPENIAQYCHKHGIAQEMAQAFAWRVRDFCPTGEIALIINSKTLFNNSDGDKRFRQKMLSECYLHTVVNFSALRKKRSGLGRNLFISAVGPAAILIFNATIPANATQDILYCTPKPTRFDKALTQITIDASEIQHIPRDQFLKADWAWKIGMWGTQRDFMLIEKLSRHSLLNEHIIEENGWYKGVGLQKPNGGSKSDEDLEDLPLVKASSILRYWGSPITFEYKRLGTITYTRVGTKKTYRAPMYWLSKAKRIRDFVLLSLITIVRSSMAFGALQLMMLSC